MSPNMTNHIILQCQLLDDFDDLHNRLTHNLFFSQEKSSGILTERSSNYTRVDSIAALMGYIIIPSCLKVFCIASLMWLHKLL
jgi:hypothetical protein